jgi:hypothetical protein
MAAVNFSIKVVDQNGSSLSGMRIELYATPLLDPWHDSLYTVSPRRSTPCAKIPILLYHADFSSFVATDHQFC